MNKYTFFYRSDSVSGDLCATYRAVRLSSALRLFWRDSLKFSSPVTCLLPNYEVLNSDGKLSYRILPQKYLEELV